MRSESEEGRERREWVRSGRVRRGGRGECKGLQHDAITLSVWIQELTQGNSTAKNKPS